GMAVQVIVAAEQLRELSTVLWPGRPHGTFCRFGPAGCLKSQRFSLGLDGLAESLALDRLNIDFPTTIRQLLDGHYTALPHRTCRSCNRFLMCLYRSRSLMSFEA